MNCFLLCFIFVLKICIYRSIPPSEESEIIPGGILWLIIFIVAVVVMIVATIIIILCVVRWRYKSAVASPPVAGRESVKNV
jgi:heme/copper-type cytochrome/quinol oxidase subunit 2